MTGERFTVEIDGTTYVRWVTTSRPDGRPDADDELVFEVRTADFETVLLFVSRFAGSGEMKLTAMTPDLRIGLVEWALADARAQMS